MKTIFAGRAKAARNRARIAGYAMVAVVGIIGVLGIIIGGLINSAVTQRKLSDRYQLYQQEMSIAEFQLNKTFAEISYALKKAGSINPQTVVDQVAYARVPNYTVMDFQKQLLSDSTGVIPAGETWQGYNLRKLVYRVGVKVRRTDAFGSRYPHPGVGLQQDMEVLYVPLYAFGIFSNVDLEVHPGQNFLETGRIHSNRRLYFGADGANMDIQNYVTSAEHFQYGRDPNSPQYRSNPNGKGLGQGRNRFWDGSAYVDNRQNGVNVDWMYNMNGDTWPEIAQRLWNGYVRDVDLGVAPMNLPWPEVVPTSELIQPANASDFGPLLSQKLVYKAGLLITRENGQTVATKPDGTVVPLTYRSGNQTLSIVSTGSFYNEREQAMVNTLNIDMARLNAAGIAPPNGIVYVQNKDTGGAVRLLNASDLPGDQALGFTVATPGAIYLQGDYNTVNQTLSMVAADAINILSSGWNDTDNNNSTKRNANNYPNASGPVTTNAVMVAGNVPTQVDPQRNPHYSGGVENFFRYMERWGGQRTHTFAGSIVLLFNSVLSTGTWDRQNYTPPARVWAWDQRLRLNGPPGAPITFVTNRTNWKLREN
jgi:hypothetical protein